MHFLGVLQNTFPSKVSTLKSNSDRDSGRLAYPQTRAYDISNTSSTEKLTTSLRNCSRPIISKGFVIVAISHRIIANPARVKKQDAVNIIDVRQTTTTTSIQNSGVIPRCVLYLMSGSWPCSPYTSAAPL